MLQVTNPKLVSIQTKDGLVFVPGVVIKNHVDDEDFVIEPGGSAVMYDHRALRLKEVYPWLVVDSFVPEPKEEPKVEEKKEIKHKRKRAAGI